MAFLHSSLTVRITMDRVSFVESLSTVTLNALARKRLPHMKSVPLFATGFM